VRTLGLVVQFAATVILVGAGLASGSQIYAKHMEIIRTPDGEATVFRDSVVITDKDTKITGQVARMYESRGLAAVSEQVFIQNPDARIWADSVLYHLSDRRAELFGNVLVRQESIDIRAPRLLYNSADKQVQADSGILMENTTRGFRLTGRKGTYDLANGVGFVDSVPVLSWSQRQDSARVTGTRMLWHEDQSQAVAQGDVRLTSGASELTCDTISFFSGPDTGIAWGRPQMHDNSSRASGDSMIFRLQDGALEQVGVKSNASGQYRTDGGDVIDVKAQTIHLWLVNGDIEHIEVSRLISGQLTRSARISETDSAGGSDD